MEQLLSELQQLLVGVSIMQDLTMRAKDSLVSFGERLSTRLFAAFLRKEVRFQPYETKLPVCTWLTLVATHNKLAPLSPCNKALFVSLILCLSLSLSLSVSLCVSVSLCATKPHICLVGYV